MRYATTSGCISNNLRRVPPFNERFNSQISEFSDIDEDIIAF